MALRFPKPARGSLVLEREEARANALKHEREEKAAVKKRDVRCRWPSDHRCRFGLECAHLKDASLGGLMDRANLILVCAWIHRRGPESIHGKQLQIEPDTSRGSAGPCSFWRQGEDGVYYLVAREVRRGVIEKD